MTQDHKFRTSKRREAALRRVQPVATPKGICPECGEGPFRALWLHTRKHK